MINPEDLRPYLQIDKSRLDDELVEQSQLFFNISEAFVEAADRRDTLKEDLAVIDADLDVQFRQDAETTGERITEASIKSLIRTSKEHKEAYTEFSRAKNLADKLQALKESFHMRSSMLKHLCEIYLANYFETNSVKGTERSDTAVYMQRRERMALERAKKR